MPLLKRKPVASLPLPAAVRDGTLPDDAQVFLMSATGEIFLDYPSYAQRMSFYLQKIFTCEYTGKTGLDYFQCLDSEFLDSQKTQAKFPEALKPKILRACQFQVEGRLESLVDACFERFNNRYFLNEKVIITGVTEDEGMPEKPHNVNYYGLIANVEPPSHIKQLLPKSELDMYARRDAETLLDPFPRGVFYSPILGREVDTRTKEPGERPDPDPNHARRSLAYDLVAHSVGMRLELSKADADAQDPPDDYVYSVRLMINNHFEGTEVHVSHSNLSRDRQAWSKNLLKKYLKECIERDPAVGAPWMVKDKLAVLYAIPRELPQTMRIKSELARDELLTKRRGGKPKRELPDPESQPAKRSRAKRSTPLALRANGHSESSPAIKVDPASAGADSNESMQALQAGPSAAKAKPVKYPIEDLELDPTTIFDGRVRRSKNELPPLPELKMPKSDLPIPQEHFGEFLACWNFLNIFGHALQLSPFTLDDFASALLHTELDPRCVLLGEIHAVLTSNIAAEGFRMAGTTQASVESIPYLAATYVDEDGMTVEERETWAAAALDYCRGWDRRARPKASELRAGWEHHLLGILTQRGGLETMPGLPAILKHLFTDEEFDAEDEAAAAAAAERKTRLKREMSEDEAEDFRPEGKDGPQASNGHVKADKDDDEEVFDRQEEAKSQPADGVKKETTGDSKGGDVRDKLVANGTEGRGSSKGAEEAGEEGRSEEEGDELAATPVNGSFGLANRNASKPRFAGTDNPDPEYRYLSLSLAQKLEILTFLCNFNLASKVVRNYIEDCDLRLTEERREKAELNRERKELLAERAALLNLDKAAEGGGLAGTGIGTEGAEGENASLKLPGAVNDGMPSSAVGTPVATPSMEIDETTSILSALPSDRDNDSILPEDGPSRQPTASPSPEPEEEAGRSRPAAAKRSKGKRKSADRSVIEDEFDRDEVAEEDEVEEEAAEEMEEEEEEEDELSAAPPRKQYQEYGDEDGSEIDELASSGDDFAKPAPRNAGRKKKGGRTTRSVATRSRRGKAKKGASGAKKGQAKKKKTTKAKSPTPQDEEEAEVEPEPVDRKVAIEEELELNAKKDDIFERDWRRHREVARIRPLGKDRFYQRYWWFDGIGPQNLVANEKDGKKERKILYGTGRLFVQGPSAPDWKMACDDFGGEEAVTARMVRETGNKARLAVEEWAYYETEEDIEQLLSWLNTKGVREHALKANLQKWKHYIVGGSQSRMADLALVLEAEANAGVRRTRLAAGAAAQQQQPHSYLDYENTLAQK